MDNQHINHNSLGKSDNLRKLFKTTTKSDEMRKKMDCGNLNVLHNDLSLLSSAYGQQQISNALHIAEKSATKLNPSYFTTSTTTTYTHLNSDHHQSTTEQLQAFIQMNNAYAMAAQITNQHQHTNNSKSTLSSAINSPLSITTTSLTPLTNVVHNRNYSFNKTYNYETPSSSSPSSNSNSQFSACSASISPASNFDLNCVNNLNAVNNVNNLNNNNNSFNDTSRMTNEFSNITDLLTKTDQNRIKLNQLKSSSANFMTQNVSNSANGQTNYQQQTDQQQNSNTNTTSNTTSHKRSRRRVATIAQRRAANVRERKR